MNTNKHIEELIIAAENMIYHWPTVPSAPLAAAQHLVERLLPDSCAPDDWSDAAYKLADAIECVEWSFWPPEEYGSRQAHVDIGNLETVAECLAALKKEIGV